MYLKIGQVSWSLGHIKTLLMKPAFAKKRAISASYVSVMADLVESRGGNRKALLKKAGISRIQGEDYLSFITMEQYEALLKGAIETTGDPAIGLHLGKAIQFSDHGTFAYSALSFPSVWDALKVGLKFSKLANQVVDLKMEEGQRFNTIRIDTAYFSGSLYQTLIETVMSLFCEILKFMLKEDISSVEIDFSYGAPDYVSLYHEVFDTTLSFEAPANEVRIPRKLANKPQIMANSEIAKKFEKECDALIAKIYEPKDFPQQVHEALFLSRGYFPQLEEIAQQINISPRTLRRRLQESGTSYKIILDNVRLELANRYLTLTDQSIGKIAERLGYADQNSFSYAYKKLTGIPPTQYRKQRSR